MNEREKESERERERESESQKERLKLNTNRQVIITKELKIKYFPIFLFPQLTD